MKERRQRSRSSSATTAGSRSAGRRQLRSSRRRRLLRTLVTLAALSLVGVCSAVWFWSGVRLAADPTAIARVDAQPFAGVLESASAVGPSGERIRLTIHGRVLIPRERLQPG